MLAKQYSIMEVRHLLIACEGQGPGAGGHAIATHGEARDDVTDRHKPNDSAFQRKIKIFGKKLVVPVETSGETRDVAPMDQAMVVAFALNSDKGQEKLRKLDREANAGTFSTAIVTLMQAIGNVLPELRIGHGATEGAGTLPRIKVELFKIDGRLHIHTAYAIA